MLLQRGVYVGPVVSPGVPPGQERLRFFITSEHTEEQLRRAADQVNDVIGSIAQVGSALTTSDIVAMAQETVGGHEGRP